MKLSFRCSRCLLLVEIDAERHRLAARGIALDDLYPEGWKMMTVSGEYRWRCATCEREVASGSPEWLGPPPRGEKS